jgi:hypothetical protein
MEYQFRCPDPDDKEAWRQWIKCHLWCVAVVAVVLAAIFILLKL